MHTGCGIGLKPCHYEEILQRKPELSFLEIHPENYMVEGGLQLYYLEKIRHHYPISMHGVGMSLGSAQGVDDQHLDKLCHLVKNTSPALVSEHLSWSHGQGAYFNDLLPLPYTEESLQLLKSNIHKVQDKLQRNILVENPSTYITFANDELSEQAFLRTLCEQTGCKLLLDINNVFVSTSNHQQDPRAYLAQYPFEYVEEIHLAGHSVYPLVDTKTIRIDDHGSEICDDVWQLFSEFFPNCKTAIPVLIEWDTNPPELDVLLQQAETAKKILHNSFR
ncbi:MAG: DUF692 domain-containing protein [Cellvibrionaceae bacterium]|nr:DUF692 domain-containing protein [Cellvibrionaceae bacterium]